MAGSLWQVGAWQESAWSEPAWSGTAPPTPPSVRSSWSEGNIGESIARYLAAKLLDAGYFVYWQNADALQTPAGFYFEYLTQFETYKANSVFWSALATATGLVTLTSKWSANPQYPVRPKNDGTGSAQDAVQVPYLAIEVGPWVNHDPIGLGTTTRYRTRHLVVYGAARDGSEQTFLRDALAEWIDEDQLLDVTNYDAPVPDVIGDARATMVTTDSAIVGLAPGPTSFELVLNSLLEIEV